MGEERKLRTLVPPFDYFACSDLCDKGFVPNQMYENPSARMVRGQYIRMGCAYRSRLESNCLPSWRVPT